MIIVIEPHADDAFLSLGGHIENWQKEGEDVTIVTVFSGTRKRGRDAEAYASAVGAAWYGLGAVEPDAGGIAGAATEALKAGLPVVLRDLYAGKRLSIMGPLGIKHPEHQEVHEVLSKVKLGNKGSVNYYLDQPYAATQANGPEVNRLLTGRRVLSFLRPGIRKYKHIPLFRDQQKFFHFNPADKLAPNIELIVMG